MVSQGELAVSLPDSIVSVATDTIATIPVPVYGIVLTAPEKPWQAPRRNDPDYGVSLILCCLFILFLIISLRFRNNMKFVVTTVRDLISTRIRQNVFDDTVRESSLSFLLNLLWCVSVGIIGSNCLFYFYPSSFIPSPGAIEMLLGIVFAIGYTMFMSASYFCLGWIFTDKDKGKMWVKGYSASHMLSTPFFFITALVSLCWHNVEFGVVITAITIFVTARLIFIWKGFRIFFNQISSWVLFLCYLCSLEIVPLVLTWRLAIFLERVLT